MDVIIKQAKVIDPNSKHHLKQVDILIKNGTIEKIGKTISGSKSKLFTAKNLHISPGWFDMRVNFCDPGFEYKEDLKSGIQAAASGGITGVACVPSTLPVVDTKSSVDYIKNQSKGEIVDVHPIGAISKDMGGTVLSEMYDMWKSGAVAFGNDKNSVQNPDLLKRALFYASKFGTPIMNFANDNGVAQQGIVNEGPVSTSLGLKGIPALAEELMVARDLALAEYSGGKLHFSTISTKKSVELIKKAKQNGLDITAEVAAHQLALDDHFMDDFDTNYKVMPPLRTKTDIAALIKGIKEGTIDAICSDHSPHEEEAKKREFEHASFGIIGLETMFALINTTLKGKIELTQIINAIAIKPREILNLTVPKIEAGNQANLTLFDPSLKWTFTKKDIHSKSDNTPFIGKEFTGKALGILNNKKLVKA